MAGKLRKKGKGKSDGALIPATIKTVSPYTALIDGSTTAITVNVVVALNVNERCGLMQHGRQYIALPVSR